MTVGAEKARLILVDILKDVDPGDSEIDYDDEALKHRKLVEDEIKSKPGLVPQIPNEHPELSDEEWLKVKDAIKKARELRAQGKEVPFKTILS